jgi:hemolysin activation/secretion protein
LTWGNTPWCQLSYFGGSKIMRGYWEERFRDKMESDVTVELRQHVYGRHGFAVWVGAGTVYQKFKELRFKEIMPNYGLGYRWEFKKGVNVRLDMGFGKWHEKGVNFSINEAF